MAFCPQEQDGGADGQQDPHHERGGVRDSDHQDVRLGETLRRSHRRRQEVKIPKGFVVCRKQKKNNQSTPRFLELQHFCVFRLDV